MDSYPIHGRLVLEATKENQLTESLGSMMIEVDVEQWFSVGQNQRSQVLLVRVVEPECNLNLQPLVAKVFDPNLVPFVDRRAWPEGPQQFCTAGKEAEVAAYTRLEPFQGRNIPHFYGEFRFHDQSDLASTYSVHSILLQFINLPSLADFEPKDYSPSERNVIKSEVYDLLDKFHEQGVYRIDQNPANWFWNRRQSTLMVCDFEDTYCVTEKTPDFVRDTLIPEWTLQDRGDLEATLHKSCGVGYKLPVDYSLFQRISDIILVNQ